MKKDISIEYAHIYTHNRIGDEQELSLEVLRNITTEYKNKNIALLVMVDDYSFPDPSFDYSMFTVWLEDQGFKPDLVLRESQLIPICDEVLKQIDDEHLTRQLSDYIRSKKYPCSLFIAAWYLLRLGYFSHPSFSDELYAEQLINILPSSFKPFEDKAFEIIQATRFKDACTRIENKYFEGRLVA